MKRKAGWALKQVLETYGISQNQVANTMRSSRSTFGLWVRGERDPQADNVVEIVKTLRKINLDAAKEFIYLYLENELDSEN